MDFSCLLGGALNHWSNLEIKPTITHIMVKIGANRDETMEREWYDTKGVHANIVRGTNEGLNRGKLWEAWCCSDSRPFVTKLLSGGTRMLRYDSKFASCSQGTIGGMFGTESMTITNEEVVLSRNAQGADPMHTYVLYILVQSLRQFLLSCINSLLNSQCCSSRQLLRRRSPYRLVGYDDIFKLVLRNSVDGICVYQE